MAVNLLKKMYVPQEHRISRRQVFADPFFDVTFQQSRRK